jgi:hypothetical protein
MRRFTLALLPILMATPAAAQFPPPGAYACVDGAGTTLGTLLLVPSGDYAWTTPDGVTAEGQIASAANSVRALSGVLFEDYHLSGAFETDEAGDTRFVFSSDRGEIRCGPPPA